MEFVADLHIHSPYSRATSKAMTLEALDQAALTKGIKVLATGDFTHPLWFQELSCNLELAAEGLYSLKGQSQQTRFILSAEISCIYSQGGKVRRIHLLVLAPNLETVAKINTQLQARGCNLKSDGRPIVGLTAHDLTEIILTINPACAVIPSHIWTPWFALFGSKSGFNTIEECFAELTPYIFAMETGLSSDPAMNWRLTALDRIALISNSDSHSAAKIGREANVFNTDLNYHAILQALKKKDPNQFLSTIEFFPQEGKYHYDGHRACRVCFTPEQTKKHQGLCPVCHKPLVVGVLSRVEELADRPVGFQPKNAIPFKNLIPLQELVAQALDIGVGSKAVSRAYNHLINTVGNELTLLLKTPLTDLESQGSSEIAEAVDRMRQGKVLIEPGYDGEYGTIKIFTLAEKKSLKQKSLF